MPPLIQFYKFKTGHTKVSTMPSINMTAEKIGELVIEGIALEILRFLTQNVDYWVVIDTCIILAGKGQYYACPIHLSHLKKMVQTSQKIDKDYFEQGTDLSADFLLGLTPGDNNIPLSTELGNDI